jgi:hypothetical protein
MPCRMRLAAIMSLTSGMRERCGGCCRNQPRKLISWSMISMERTSRMFPIVAACQLRELDSKGVDVALVTDLLMYEMSGTASAMLVRCGGNDAAVGHLHVAHAFAPSPARLRAQGGRSAETHPATHTKKKSANRRETGPYAQATPRTGPSTGSASRFHRAYDTHASVRHTPWSCDTATITTHASARSGRGAAKLPLYTHEARN